MNSNTNAAEVQKLIDAAIAPLKAQVQVLAIALAKSIKDGGAKAHAMEIPEPVKQMQQLFSAVPAETISALGATGAILDPNMPWAKIVRENGQTISIKMGNDLRFRVRDENQALIKELHAPINALASTLAKLI